MTGVILLVLLIKGDWVSNEVRRIPTQNVGAVCKPR